MEPTLLMQPILLHLLLRYSFTTEHVQLDALKKKNSRLSRDQQSSFDLMTCRKKKKKKKAATFNLHGRESAGTVSTPRDLAMGCRSFVRLLELASVSPSKSYVKVQPWRNRQVYFGMKCVGSQRVTGDNFNWMNTIPSYSSIPVEKLFLGDALQGTRHSGKKYHTVGRNGGMTHLILYAVLPPGKGVNTRVSYTQSSFWLENKSNFESVILFPASKNRSVSQLLTCQSLSKQSMIIWLHY